mgnify:CR=1 FL=1
MAAGNRKSSNKRKTQTKKERMAEMEKAQAFRVEVTLWIVVAAALLLFISNLGFGGAVGKTVSGFLFGMFGLMAYVLPVLLLVGSFFAVSNRGNKLAAVKLIAAIVFLVFLCTFMGLTMNGNDRIHPLDAYTYCAERHTGGGIIGGCLAYYMCQAFGLIGSFIIDIIVLIVCMVLITERSALRGMQKGGKKVYESAKESNEKYREYREYRAQERKERRMDHKVSGVSIDTRIEEKGKKNKKRKSDEMGELSAPAFDMMPDTTVSPMPKKISSPAPVAVLEEPAAEIQPEISGDFMPDTFPPEPSQAAPVPEHIAGLAPAKDVLKPAEKTQKKKNEQEIQNEVQKVAQEMETSGLEHKPDKAYVFPSIDLLKKGEGKKSANTEHQLRETADKLQQTLKNFGVNVTVTNISCGPAVTRYEIQPEMGVKVSKIVGLTDDIKLNLAAADIRIEAPIPGKAAVGIEVPNKENVMVAFRDLIESPEFQTAKSKISFAVGKDIAGKVVVADIAKMPHLLVAGATGSGKSVCINTLIMSIIYKADPEDVKLILVDPKVVELSVYNGIPHLMIPVVTDPKKAAGALNWAVAEMEKRYKLFAEYNVRDLKGFNEKVLRGETGEDEKKKLPQIIIIIDELADLMMVAPGEVEGAICRLAQLARAAGLHLILATQRPSVNVITGLIKANMPSRIAFSVSSGVDSRTIIDMNGAEKLLGKGDMLFYPSGYPKPVRVQGSFVSDKEVQKVVDYLIDKNGSTAYSNELEEHMMTADVPTSISGVSAEDTDDRDVYFTEAGQLIIDKDRASIGMLQRMFKIGFNRAARIMDQLAEAGVVGPEEGTKPRKVLMSKEEFDAYIAENKQES